MMSTPPIPTRFIASRSAVMPSRVRLPSDQNQNTHGFASSGGRTNAFSRRDSVARRMEAVASIATTSTNAAERFIFSRGAAEVIPVTHDQRRQNQHGESEGENAVRAPARAAPLFQRPAPQRAKD